MKPFRTEMDLSLQKNDKSNVELLPVESLSGSVHPSANEDDPHTAKDSRQSEIRGWPQQPQTLREPPWMKICTSVVDAIIALIPILFIVLSIMAMRLSGSELSAHGQKVKAATALGPTIFPIIFAAIVGRSLRSLATFQAERGAKLGKLEQMMGSLTIFGPVEMQFVLRTFDLLGVCLIMLWLLSPLGGQASLRLLEEGSHPAVTTQEMLYVDSDSESVFTNTNSFEDSGFLVNALYLSAVLSAPPTQSASMDTWGNVKIPTIEKFEAAGKAGPYGWFAVSPKNATYSSLVGIPIAGFIPEGSYNFLLESFYMVLSCPSVGTISQDKAGGFTVNCTLSPSLDQPLYANSAPYPAVISPAVNFTSRSISSQTGFIASCTLTRSSVESNITCAGKNCGVTNIRRSLYDQRPPGYTPLNGNYGPYVSENFALQWPQSAGTNLSSGTSTLMQYFIQDPTLKSLSLSIMGGGISLNGIEADVFSERFSLLFNTYWQCGLVPWLQTGNLPHNTSALAASQNQTGGAPLNSTIATVTKLTEIYVCNKIWATTLLVASCVLLFCGVSGAIVAHRTRGPQILGRVSTMTRDNPHVVLPPGGCTLNGLDRSRLLKDLRVQVQDVATGEPVGHIALGDAGVRSRRLAMGRSYAGFGQITETKQR